MSEPFVGEILIVGFNFAPRNFAFCNGQQLSISQNAALFSLLGTTYGGNGQTTFALPNLQGRAPIHQGQLAGGSNYVLGEAAGVENTTILSSQMPVHNHQAVTTVNSTISTQPTAVTTINAFTQPPTRQTSPAGGILTGGLDSSSNPVNIYTTGGTAATLGTGAATTTLSGGAIASPATTTIGTAGGSLPLSILQPFLVLNYVIALYGIFPPRN